MTRLEWAAAIKYLVAAGVMFEVARQCRKPRGLIGRAMAASMNRSHRELTQWALGHLTLDPAWQVLDIGCGGGQTIRELAASVEHGRVSGVDYSPASVATAQRTNRDLIAAGRVDIQAAGVSQLPFPAGVYDLATAVETHYYWPHPVEDLREVLRVLRPGGTLALVAEAYRGRRMDWLYRPAMRLLGAVSYLTPAEHRDLFVAAGYTGVQVYEDRGKGWLCVIGRRGA